MLVLLTSYLNARIGGIVISSVCPHSNTIHLIGFLLSHLVGYIHDSVYPQMRARTRLYIHNYLRIFFRTTQEFLHSQVLFD